MFNNLLKTKTTKKWLTIYGIFAICITVLIAAIFTVGMVKMNKNVQNIYSMGVETQESLVTVQTNLMKIGANYLELFSLEDSSKVAAKLSEVDAWTAEDKERLTAFEEMGLQGEYKQQYDAVQEALAPYRDTRNVMDALLLKGNFSKAREYFTVFEAQRTEVDKQVAALTALTSGTSEALVGETHTLYSRTLLMNIIIFIILFAALLFFSIVIIKFIRTTMDRCTYAANELARGNVKLDIELNREENAKNDIMQLENILADLVDITKIQAETLEGIAGGNIDVTVDVRSDDDVLNHSMKKVINTLKGLKASLLNLTKAFEKGDTAYRTKAESFHGAYRDIMEGTNTVVDIMCTQLADIAAAVGALGQGQLVEVDVNRPGDYGAIFKELRATIDSIGSLVEDTQAMANAALEGDYTVRADESKYQGDYQAVIKGINDTLNMVVDKTNWYVNIIDSFPMPVQVMDENQSWTLVNKRFAEYLKAAGVINEEGSEVYGRKCEVSSININGVSAYEAGNPVTRFEFSGGIFEQQTAKLTSADGETIGYLGAIQDMTAVLKQAEYSDKAAARLEKNLTNLANGVFEFEANDIPRNEYTKSLEVTFDAIDTAVENVTGAVELLVTDSVKLANYAVSGQLDKRAPLDRYSGEYAKVMKGMNETVDALTAPINELIAVLEAVGNGDLSKEVYGDYQGDLVKSKNALNSTVHTLRAIIDEIKNALAAIGDGDLTVAISDNYKGDFVAIKDSLVNIIANLTDIMGNINEASQQVAAGSRQLSEGAQNLADGSTKQAAAIQELGSTMDSVAEQTRKNTEDARRASTLSTEVMHKAEQGNAQMKDMLVSMQEINESSANISKIIKVIDDIAFQTNILALNAAVEAARAGVHGKGFAVVADEVRNLAAKSAQAASETTTLIEGSVSKVNAGTQIANATAEALEAIVTGITETSNLCDAIAVVSDEQSMGIDEVNKGIEDVSQVVQSNSATAEESAASAEELYSQADTLKNLVAQFKLKGGQGSFSAPVSSGPRIAAPVDNMPTISLDLDFGSDKY